MRKIIQTQSFHDQYLFQVVQNDDLYATYQETGSYTTVPVQTPTYSLEVMP